LSKHLLVLAMPWVTPEDSAIGDRHRLGRAAI
jgi:hypothetical protein